MSGGLPTQDQAAILREATVASLVGYGVTAAGVAVPVESERVDPVEDGAMPRIIVYADDSATSDSGPNTAPAFAVTCTLVLQMLAQRAQRADAVADLDAMIAQTKDALFSDPTWAALSAGISTVRVSRSLKFEGHRVLGDARMQIECTWREVYPPRVRQVLSTVTLTTTPPDGTQAIAAGSTLGT
jgi:hypothetical protein